MKPKLLVVELWAVGDVMIASPFLRQASEQFEVTLLAKPFAFDLRPRFWPGVEVVPFKAPWTAFKFTHKYRLYSWPWRSLRQVLRRLSAERFDVAVSARWDPRDHLLMKMTGARRRAGFPRVGSQRLLTDVVAAPDPASHRYEYWRTIGAAIGVAVPPREQLNRSPQPAGRVILVHSGAAQPVRVWPIDRYAGLVRRLRGQGYTVRVVANPDTLDAWQRAGESDVATPTTLTTLLDLMTDVGVLIGNDSGPGHLAAFLGIPAFTIFGPMLPDWWLPLHPSATWIEGKPCPYKPCSDNCRFPTPHCLLGVTENEVWQRLQEFLRHQLPLPAAA